MVLIPAYGPFMPDLWFALGLAMGIVVTGFASVGSFDRGVASVRRGVINAELSARRRAIVARRSAPRAAAADDGPERLQA